jgi:dTDP-4-amino-4,6-dideoxygalactose transaminase
LFHKIYYSHNFGHNGPLAFYGLGINGKISELHAAMGLSILPYMDELIASRKRIVEKYDNLFNDIRVIKKIKLRTGTKWNFSYYPLIFSSEKILLTVESKLNAIDVMPRRYFYPSLNKLSYCLSGDMEVAQSISSSILCIPIYHDLLDSDVKKIAELIIESC